MNFLLLFAAQIISIIAALPQLYAMENNQSLQVSSTSSYCYLVNYSNGEYAIMPEIWKCILSELALNDLFQCNSVCKVFKEYAQPLLDNAPYPYEINNNHLEILERRAWMGSCILQSIHAAQRAVVSVNPDIQQCAFILLESMVQREQAVWQAMKAAELGIKSVNEKVILAVFYCMAALANKGHPIDISGAYQKIMATAGLEYIQSYALAIKDSLQPKNALNEMVQ